MIYYIGASPADANALAGIHIDSSLIADDFYDYSKVVVKKPWGYEYLMFQNDVVAVWILHIKEGAQTSMHCHPHKKTSLVLLKGEVICSSLTHEFKLQPGGGLMIDRGVFHQTRATSNNGAFVMETETPVNKRDLVRLKDRYGREGQGYESEGHHSFNTQNYNYISFRNPEIQHNLKKRFGQCSLTLVKVTDQNVVDSFLGLDPEDVICILNGQLLDAARRPILEIGDTTTVVSLRDISGLRTGRQTEALVIRKIDRIIKVSDYIASFLNRHQLETVFIVPGDANVHLLDSIGRQEGLSYICPQTEKSAAHAVEAFGKLRSEVGVLVVSSGASTANAIPGVANAWIDSVPMLIISGQARSDQDSDGPIRQLGNKSLATVNLVKAITKYSVKVTDATTIRYHLEKAIHLAKEGRPGPVWLDLPIDVQGLYVDEEELKCFDPRECEPLRRVSEEEKRQQVAHVIDLLKQSSRPAILAGSGIRTAGAHQGLLALIDRLKVPVLTSRRGADLVPDSHPYAFGRPGAYGQRSANFVIQNCDLLISIGSRLSIPLVGRNTRAFARAARKIVIDIDPVELEKPTVNPDVAIAADAGVFIAELLRSLPARMPDYGEWIEQCREWRRIFPPSSYSGPSLSFNDPEGTGLIYPLHLLRALSDELVEDDVIVADGGPPLIYTLLAFRFKPGQRLISAPGLELPGFGLPGAIGACIARGRKPVICLCEDRGVQISLHDVQTLLDYDLPVKVIVLKSKGHSIIRNIQKDYFGERFVGTDNEIRLGPAPLMQIAKAYGLATFEVSSMDQFLPAFREVRAMSEPAFCEIRVENDQAMIPRPDFIIREDRKWVARPLEDMYPLLDREVLKQNMIIDVVQED